MEIILYLAVPVLVVIGVLWVIDRRKPGSYRAKNDHAVDYQRGQGGTGMGLIDPDRRDHRP